MTRRLVPTFILCVVAAAAAALAPTRSAMAGDYGCAADAHGDCYCAIVPLCEGYATCHHWGDTCQKNEQY